MLYIFLIPSTSAISEKCRGDNIVTDYKAKRRDDDDENINIFFLAIET